jgi:uncharacterized protein
MRFCTLEKCVLFVVFGLYLIFTAVAQADPIRDGAAAYKRGDYETALRLLRPLAEQGDAAGQFLLGRMYFNGHGVQKDYFEAARWHRRSADQGDVRAISALGSMYENSQGVRQDYTEAARLYRTITGMHPEVYYKLARLYRLGRGVEKDIAEAARLLTMAAIQNSSAALAEILKAAEQGDLAAQSSLGYVYYKRFWNENYPEALHWLRKAADQGDPKAHYYLGLMYAFGQGVEKDYTEAVRLIRHAAEQGVAEAQYKLGSAYRDGDAYNNGKWVKKDPAEAARWFRKAARQKYASAYADLGLIYYTGEGATKDFSEALFWFRKSVRHMGFLSGVAQHYLGRMYYKGEGVLQDYVQAHFRFNVAVKLMFEPARKYRDDITNKMTPAQIAKAQQLAREWQPGKRRVTIASRSGKGIAVPAPPRQQAPKQEVLKKRTTGSGFVVSNSGHVLTNNHVVEGCRQNRIPPKAVAVNLARDAQSDLALLKMSDVSLRPATFRQGRGIRPGNSVVIAGFPLQGVLTSDLNITTGTVSALAGPGDDRRLMQVTAPVQSGNSGGPLLDLAGNVVGVVVGKLNAMKLARLTGDIPQNVNFAIQAGTARSFLDAYNVPYDTVPSIETLPPATVADRAREFTVLIECWK